MDAADIAQQDMEALDALVKRAPYVLPPGVPGVLSSSGGSDFAAFLGGLGELGYGWAYRVLDAQYFGVAQRRRRVFVVGCLGGWTAAAAVLFEPESLRGDSAPSRRQREDVASTIAGGARSSGGYSADDIPLTPDIAMTHTRGGQQRLDPETETLIPTIGGDFGVAHTLRGEGFDAGEDGTGRGVPIVPVLPFDTTQVTSATNRSQPRYGDPCHPLAAGAHAPAIAFDCKASGRNGFGVGVVSPTLRAMGHKDSHGNAGGQVAVGYTNGITNPEVSGTLEAAQARQNRGHGVLESMKVRRLTPRECERLQGFTDDYTLIPYGAASKSKLDADFLKYQLRGNPKHLTREDIDHLAADGPRYKVLGNSMAVPVMRWLGQRITMVAEQRQQAAAP